jgi:hypothetical protein
MTRRLFTLVTVLAAGGIACQRTPAPPAPTTTQAPVEQPAAPANDPWAQKPSEAKKPDPLPHPLLFSATKDGKTSYLFGTMHIGVDAAQRMPQLVWDKLHDEPAFAMETDLTDTSILGMGHRDSGTLRDDLGEDYWQKLSKLLEPRVLEGVNRLKPMMAATILSLRGLPSEGLPMDALLDGRAVSEKKQVIYLEPASKQVNLLEKWMDVRALKMMIDTPDQGIETSKQMLAAYIAGDADKIEKLSDAQKPEQLKHGFTEKEYDQSMEDMLYARNASWIDGIEKAHASGGVFVAVGALHLIGKRSVLDLLGQKGFTIKRLQP